MLMMLKILGLWFHWIGRDSTVIWTPRSPVVTTLDFFFRILHQELCLWLKCVTYKKESLQLLQILFQTYWDVWTDSECHFNVCLVINGTYIYIQWNLNIPRPIILQTQITGDMLCFISQQLIWKMLKVVIEYFIATFCAVLCWYRD
jgi:hypothetical protein